MLAALSWPAIALLMVAGVLLDLLLGEARRWHPLIGFGNVVYRLERYFNRGRHLFWRGGLAWLLAVLPLVALSVWICHILGWVAHAVLLYFCLGLRSLREHNLPIGVALAQGDLTQARQLTARIVSRDTEHASAEDLAKASTESLLENGNDAVFGTLFWFVIGGAPGALLFRLANTLDAMWGYRTPRFDWFGCSAARIDDLLNLIPARLTALSYVVLGASWHDKRHAWQCWRNQAASWSSPNAGPVMASGAGALGLQLGGAAIYHGVLEQRATLGAGRPANGADIARAWRLIAHTTLLWLGCVSLAAALYYWRTHA